MELDRAAIEVRLEQMPRDKCVAFAVRSAMRVLPLLAAHNKTDRRFQQTKEQREVFYYWEERHKAQYLLACYRAYGVSLGSILDLDVAAARAAATATTIAAARFAATAAARATAATATAAAYAYVASRTDAIILEIHRDLDQLQQLSAIELLETPLWSQPISNHWKILLTQFKQDALSLDSGFQVWLDWYDDRLSGKTIDKALLEKWINIPAELETQGVAEINAHLQDEANKVEKRPLNRVRAIFIGYGEAGKTSLINALHNEAVVEGKEAMTRGIEIRNWKIPDSEIQAHFWDFGGQVMAHSSHQFFLRERCLYVLVLNARSEINSTEQAEYWLQHIKGFGKNAPVMLVGNKEDQASINLDMDYLTKKYPNIRGFYSLSCVYATEARYQAKFESFKQDFCRELQAVGTHQMAFNPAHFAVLEELRAYSPTHAFLQHEKFSQMCEKHGVLETEVFNREWLLDILDKLGVVIHFPQLHALDEYVPHSAPTISKLGIL